VKVGNTAVEAKGERINSDEGSMGEDGPAGMEILCSYMDKEVDGSVAKAFKFVV
jgi:hypothetical protein